MKYGTAVTFETEAALCQAFLRSLPDEWIAYPETAGWDMLLVHRVGGWQIGVEAKLSLNPKVLVQAINGIRYGDGPDFRAVLVGKVVAETAVLAKALGLTVIAPRPHEQAKFAKAGPPAKLGWARQFGPHIPTFSPDLPEAEAMVKISDWWANHDFCAWIDHFPTRRHKLPDYVPEVACGVPSPMVLSDWKIKAMRVCQWVEKHGVITRAQFKALGIDPSRWMNGVWLQAGVNRGEWVKGPMFPADEYQRAHPGVWGKIADDFDKWAAKVPL